MFLKPWYTIHLINPNPLLPGDVCSIYVVPLVREMRIKSVEVSSTSSFQALSDNSTMKLKKKHSGTRVNLVINCASSICKGIQIKCRFISPK